MGRAERRRAERKKRNKNYHTGKEEIFTITKSQLDEAIYRTIRTKIDDIKKEAEEDAVTVAMRLMFTIPMKVLMDNQWSDSYKEELPGYADLLVDYYHRWEDGELDIDSMEHDIWDYAGIKLEVADRE